MSVSAGPTARQWGENEPPPITEVEHFGIEPIPPADRTATPFDLFRVAFGGANTFATVVLGTFPILLFGLSFYEGVLAVLLGIVAGGIILAPMALFGPANGTNNAVSSGAHFGVVGRIVGSFLSLLTAVTFFAISIFTSGDILVGALDRLLGTGQSKALLTVAYALFAIAILVICLYGFRFMLATNKVAVIAATLLYILGTIAYGPEFDPGFGGSRESLLPAFIGSTLIVMSNPLSFGAFLGDWSRYIPPTASKTQLMLAAFFSQLATVIPFVFGLATASVIAATASEDGQALYSVGLVEITPGWFLIPVALIAVIGGLSTGTTSLYGTGLDFSSVVPFLSRFQSTLLVGSIATAIVLVALYTGEIITAIITFATLIIVCTTPWVVIMAIGYFARRGFYRPDDLQVFNRGQRGGSYWFSGGYNWRGLAAWIPAALVGVFFVNIPEQFEGPLRNTFGGVLEGVDVSLVVVIVLAAVLYILFELLFPEPREVYGPEGPRLFRAAEGKPPPPIEAKT